MDFINDIMNLNYFFAVIINFLIGLILYLYIINEKKEHPDWDIPKQVFSIIASYFIIGLIPEFNKFLLLLTLLFICYIVLVFILSLVLFESKLLINRFLFKNKNKN